MTTRGQPEQVLNPTPLQVIEQPADEHNGFYEATKPISEDGLRVSEEVYWANYYEHPDFSYEWNDGILEEKPVADPLNSALYQWFLVALYAYLRVRPIARLINLEIGFRLALPHKTTIRKPDLFVVHNDNPIAAGDADRTYKGICDLCVESLSTSTKKEIERDTVHKKAEYDLIGVREYYLLDARRVHTAFYRRTPAGHYGPIDAGPDGIIRSEVLPGFQFRIADLYRQPSLIEMAEDPLYSDFVLPEYLAEKRRAERLAAKLRELGINETAL